jgi:hypothetical protein
VEELAEYLETFEAMGMVPTTDDLEAAGFSEEVYNRYLAEQRSPLEYTGVTVFNKPVFTDDETGEQYSERTETMPIGVSYMASPTIDPTTGDAYDEETLKAFYREYGPIDPYTNDKLPTFDTEKEAEEYARYRSENQFNPALLDANYYSPLDGSAAPQDARGTALDVYNPTLRERSRIKLSSFLRDTLGFDQYGANRTAERFLGVENPTDGGMGFGPADLTPLGLIFGAEEAKRNFRRAQNADDKVGMALAGVEGALTVAEALPLTGVALKGTKNLVKALADSNLIPEYDPSMVGSNLGNIFGPSAPKPTSSNLVNYDANTIKALDDSFNNKRSEVRTGASTDNAAKLGVLPEAGTRVGLRPNLNSTIPDNPTNNPRGKTQLVSVHGAATRNNPIGKILSYLPHATAENVTFYVNQTKRAQIGAMLNDLPVPEAKDKNPAMSVDGAFAPNRNVLLEGGDDIVEIGIDPKNSHLFMDMSNMQAVESAEVATQVGNRVYAKGVKYMSRENAPEALKASDGTELPNVVTFKFETEADRAATDQTDELFGMGHNQGPPLEANLKQVIDARANEMSKPVGKRTGALGEALFDTSPEAYERNSVPQTEIYTPRNPDPAAKLPLGDRSRAVQDRVEEIAQVLAQRMEPWKGTAAQYFYNTEPIREKALEMGYSPEYVDEWMKEFSEAYAATSPRTETAQNLRNATLVMAKNKQGIPLDEIIGPGTGGISEKGYNMMTGESGIHRILTDQVREGGINPNNNTKPFTFAKNVEGNLNGATIDTHAIRGALDAMNEVEPGSIPDGWIEPQWLEAYKQDPTQLDPVTWLKDTLGKQQIGGEAMQTEYAVFSDIYRRAGEIANVSPAEAQSMGWFGSGDKTGLKSETKTVVELLDERIGVTANVLGFSRQEIFRMLMDRQIPLLSVVGGMGGVGAAGLMSNEDGI